MDVISLTPERHIEKTHSYKGRTSKGIMLTYLLMSVVAFQSVFGDCPYRLPAKERLQMSRTDYFKFYSENPGIEDMLRGSRTAFVGPDMANVTVIIKAKCTRWHALCSEYVPLQFRLKKLIVQTKCVKGIHFYIETVWASAETGIDSLTGNATCVRKAGISWSNFREKISNPCGTENVEMSNYGVYSLIKLTFELSTDCAECQNVSVKHLMLNTCAEECPDNNMPKVTTLSNALSLITNVTSYGEQVVSVNTFADNWNKKMCEKKLCKDSKGSAYFYDNCKMC